MDEESHENALFYYNRYVTIKDLKYIKLNSVNSLYLIFDKVNEHTIEIQVIYK